MEPYSRVAVIVGFPRSGTTLLRGMLARNPELDVLEVEAHYVLEMYRKFGPRLTDITAPVQFLLNHRKYPEMHADRTTVMNSLTRAQPKTLGELLNMFFRSLFGGNRATLVIKHPALIWHLAAVKDIFPNVVVLNTIRDPRAAIVSHQARWPGKGIAELSIAWSNAIRSGSRWRRSAAAPYSEVMYEELLREPVPVLAGVCTRLGVAASPEMLTIDYEQGQWDVADPGTESRRHFTYLDTSKIDGWRTKLNATDLAIIERSCGKEMIELGYTLVNPQLAFHESVQYGWRRFTGHGVSVARELKARVQHR